MFGVVGVEHGAGPGSRFTRESGTMGSFVVPRDPNRLLSEKVEGKKFMIDDVE